MGVEFAKVNPCRVSLAVDVITAMAVKVGVGVNHFPRKVVWYRTEVMAEGVFKRKF